MKHSVFIHVNHKQWLGAVVGKYALEKNSAHTDKFDVQFIEADVPRQNTGYFHY